MHFSPSNISEPGCVPVAVSQVRALCSCHCSYTHIRTGRKGPVTWKETPETTVDIFKKHGRVSSLVRREASP